MRGARQLLCCCRTDPNGLLVLKREAFAMKKQQTSIPGVNPKIKPSGNGCVECLATDGWWLHLRRCAECGHIGCCDNSPNQHATKHFRATGHPIIMSYEPGEDWFYDYQRERVIEGTELAPPRSHPQDQPVPGPDGRVPPNWQSLLNEG